MPPSSQLRRWRPLSLRQAARRWSRRAVAASLLVGPVHDAWQQRRPKLAPIRFALGHIADDCAYGGGVWAGCLRERTLVPVTPAVSWRMLRITGSASDGRDASDQRKVQPWQESGSSR